MRKTTTYRTKDEAIEAAREAVFPRNDNDGIEWGKDWQAATVYRQKRRYGILLESERHMVYRPGFGEYSAVAHVFPDGKVHNYTGK